MKTVIVKATGHGIFFNSYPVEFELSIDPWDSEEVIAGKARRKAQELTACKSVTVDSIEKQPD